MTEGQAREGEAGHETGRETGRAAVRRLLVDRLNAAGLQRPRGMAAAAFDQMQGHLCEGLAYMTGDNLMTLAETVIDNAQGGRWPVEAVVRDFAKRLQRPPPKSNRIITSWLASVEGPKAVERGDLVELYQLLRAKPVPPSDFERRQLQERAQQNRRRVQLVREKKAAGVASAEETGWLDRYLADQEAARAIVEEGSRKRAEGEAA